LYALNYLLQATEDREGNEGGKWAESGEKGDMMTGESKQPFDAVKQDHALLASK
jgi:hypothetical protein